MDCRKSIPHQRLVRSGTTPGLGPFGRFRNQNISRQKTTQFTQAAPVVESKDQDSFRPRARLIGRGAQDQDLGCASGAKRVDMNAVGFQIYQTLDLLVHPVKKRLV